MFSYEPDPNDVNSGGISISSPGLQLDFSILFRSSWRIEGFVEKELTTTWNTGEGDYYWYRVDGLCGDLKCDENGVLYPDCKNMQFFTVVAARSVGEVCDLLQSPKYTPPVNFKLSSIGKYSRPIVRENIVDECNIIEEQEFCQIAECLDYCLDEDVVFSINLDSRPIEAIFEHDMSGSVFLKGTIGLPWRIEYDADSDFPNMFFLGSADFSIGFSYSSQINLNLNNLIDVKASRYNFSSSGSIALGGFSRNISPHKYFSSIASLQLNGSSRTTRISQTPTVIKILSDFSFFLKQKHIGSGSILLNGILQEFTSPKYFYSSKGSLDLNGFGIYNFEDLGTISSSFDFNILAFGFESDLQDFSYKNNLTIDNELVNPPCGCGPLGMSLLLRHNMNNSQVLGNFFRRNGMQLSNITNLKFKKEDFSWRSTQHFSGRSRDGVAFEDISIFFILQCFSIEDIWKFTFIIKSINRTTQKQLFTKLIIDIPSLLICADNNISTSIKTHVGVGFSEITNRRQTLVVSPERQFPVRYRNNTIFVDDSINENSIYYDTLGLFKDSYWIDAPVEFDISPISREEMPTVNLQSIF